MSCPRPYVNPPECDVSYLEDRPYSHVPLIVGIALWTICLSLSWAALGHFVSSGCIRFTLDYLVFALVVIGSTLLAPSSTNQLGYVRGRLNNKAFTLCLVLGKIAYIMIPPLLVMNNRRLYCRLFLHKRIQGKEIAAYVTLLVIPVALGIVTFLVHFLHFLGEVTWYFSKVVLGVFMLVFGVIWCVLSIAWLSFLHHLKVTGQDEALKVIDSTKLTWFVTFFCCLVLIAYSFVIVMFANPEENSEPSTPSDSAVARDIGFFIACGVMIIVPLACLSLSISMTRRLRDLWSVQKLPAAAMVKSCVCTAVVYLGSVAIPQLLTFEAMMLFLNSLFPSACFGITMLLVRKNAYDEELLEDYCVAGLLRKKENEEKYGKVVANARFYMKWGLKVKKTVMLLGTLAMSPKIPWLEDTGMHALDLFQYFRFDYSEAYLLVFPMILVTSFMNVVIQVALRIFPPSPHSRWGAVINKITFFISFVLFVPALLPALGLVFDIVGAQCRQDVTRGNKVPFYLHPSIECNGEDWHRLVVQFAMGCATWCIAGMALDYSHGHLFRRRPRLVISPRGGTVTTFLIIMASWARTFPGDASWIGGFLISMVAFVWEYKIPTVIGLPRARAIQLALMACVVEMQLVSLLNFIWPENWAPFILIWAFLPVTGVGVYVSSLRRANNENIDARVEALLSYDFTIGGMQLSERNLGALLHTDNFYDYLIEVLGRKRRRTFLLRASEFLRGRKSDNVENMTPIVERVASECVAEIIRALGLISSALSVDCGRRALIFNPDLVRAAAPFLSFPETRHAASKTILAMSKVRPVAPYLRTHALKLLLDEWGAVQSPSFHDEVSQAIRLIKGGDEVILYVCSSARKDATPLHVRLQGRVVQMAAARRRVWLVPFDVHAPSHCFSTSDPIDAMLIFPPDLPLPLDLLCGDLKSCPRLCIPTSPDFTDFHSMAACDWSHASNYPSTHRPSLFPPQPKDLGLTHWAVPVHPATTSKIHTTLGDRIGAFPCKSSLFSASPCPRPTPVFKHLFVMFFMNSDKGANDPLDALIGALSLYYAGKMLPWMPTNFPQRPESNADGRGVHPSKKQLSEGAHNDINEAPKEEGETFARPKSLFGSVSMYSEDEAVSTLSEEDDEPRKLMNTAVIKESEKIKNRRRSI